MTTEIGARLEDLGRRFLPAILTRVTVLEQTAGALLDGHLRPEMREAAEREAHKLAGLLRTLGFPAGSRFAREAEELLQAGSTLSQSQVLRFSELVGALRLDVESVPHAAVEDVQEARKRPRLLVVDANEDLSENIAAEAASQGFEVEAFRDLRSARHAVSGGCPDAMLLDLLASGDESEGLALLEELSCRKPPIPVIVLTSKGGLIDRVEVARRGGRGFLAKSLSPAQIVDAVMGLLRRMVAVEDRIMAVDDDPEVLELLRVLLAPRGARIETVSDPLRFWDSLESFAPDLVVLDVDMPRLSGVELCQVVRNDTRWAETPVIFLTRHDDPDTINRVFAAGADDFVAKPIVGPELLTRIFNRLDRLHLRRRLSDIDPVTGIWNRRKASQMMADFLNLARRHGQPFSLAVMAVRDLDEINRKHGYGAGDALMERVSGVLSHAFRSEDVFARWSGDKLAVGMYGLTRYDAVERLSQVFEAARQEPMKIEPDLELHVTLSAGLAEYGDDGTDVDALYSSAEMALRHAGEAGKGNVTCTRCPCESSELVKKVDVTLVMRNEAQASLLLHALKSKGFRARWLQEGKTAEKLLTGPERSLQSKVVLIDVDLPDLDGLSLLKRLAWDGVLKDCGAIVVTAPSVNNEAAAALALGAVDCVTKPFSVPVVVQHIRRAINPS